MKKLLLLLVVLVGLVGCDDLYEHYTVEYIISSSDGSYFAEYVIPQGNFSGDFENDFYREFTTMDKTQNIYLYVYSKTSSSITATVKINDKIYYEKNIVAGESLVIAKSKIDY